MDRWLKLTVKASKPEHPRIAERETAITQEPGTDEAPNKRPIQKDQENPAEPLPENVDEAERNSLDLAVDLGSLLSDISRSVEDGPTQPKLARFQQTRVGDKIRSFNTQWYTRFPLVEYSVSKNAVFCFVCRHFQLFAFRNDLSDQYIDVHKIKRNVSMYQQLLYCIARHFGDVLKADLQHSL
jgi:hypothetical protein